MMGNNNDPLVLVCDDDSIQSQPYLTELKIRGIALVVFNNADSCLAYIESGKKVSLAIIDIMLPSKNNYTERETCGYKYTGIFLAHDLRKRSGCPIIFFSNISFSDHLSKVQTAMNAIGNCALIKKYKIAQSEDFGEIVDKALSGGIKSVARMSLLKIFSKYIVLQPNVGGVGVDLNSLLRQ